MNSQYRKPVVLMVGAGHCQINGIKALKELGCYVIAVDYNVWTPGKSLADHSVIADAFDEEAIKAVAEEYQVEGIMTMGTDQPVYTVTAACHALHLPHDLSLETASSVTHKKHMKTRLEQAGVPLVPWRLLKKGEDSSIVLESLPGPYVLKPVDSQGQRGIFRFSEKYQGNALLENTLAFSRENYALVESYYPGGEITVSGWVHNGNLEILSITDRLCFHPEKHLGVCIAHRFPSHFARGQEEAIHKWSQKVCTVLNIRRGPFYLQLLSGSKGIVINEVACRLGGAYEDITIPLITGVDVLKRVIHTTLGKNPFDGESSNISPSYKSFSTQLFFCKPGKIARAISLEDFKALPFIVDAGFHFPQNMVFENVESAVQRAGWFIVAGQNEEEVYLKLCEAYRSLKIQNSNGESLVIPWEEAMNPPLS